MRVSVQKLFLVSAMLALPAAGQAVHSRTSTATTHLTAARTPYTAEYKITSIKTLADGSTITREDTEMTALDSQGRRMNQTTTTRSKDQTPVVNTNVFDPVAKTDTHWSSLGKVATVTTISPGAEHGCQTGSKPMPRHSPRNKPTVENLGLASVQGVEARGTRTTDTIPAGEIGNEMPLVITIERWTAVAVGLKGLAVREVTDDPRSGKWSKELTSISQEEPDRALFQTPGDYQIVTKNPSDCPTESAPNDKDPNDKDQKDKE